MLPTIANLRPHSTKKVCGTDAPPSKRTALALVDREAECDPACEDLPKLLQPYDCETVRELCRCILPIHTKTVTSTLTRSFSTTKSPTVTITTNVRFYDPPSIAPISI
jgi:hypothetical protein